MGPLIQYDWCFNKEGKFRHRHTGTTQCEDEDRDQSDAEAREHQRLPASHQELGERHQTDSPSQLSEEAHTVGHLIWRSSLQTVRYNTFLSSKLHGLWCFVTGVPEN